MDHDEYVVFEPVTGDLAMDAWMPGLPQFHLPQTRSDDIFGSFSGLDVTPGPTRAPAPILDGAETMRVVTGAAGAEAARRDGMMVLRSPRMPLRLIPRVSAADVGPGPGDAWGVAATAADRTGDLGGETVCVAVLDTGIDVHHPAFAGLTFDDDTYRDFTGTGKADNVGHGTHCAGIIFGRPVDDVRIGVAPGVRHVLIGKVTDVDVTADTGVLQEALVWAVANGANIISLSLGLDFLGYSRQFEQRGFPPDVALSMALNDYRDHTRTFDRMMANVVSPGMAMKSALVIAACGNDSHADVEPMLRVQATLPAVADKVIAVGAVQRDPSGYRLAPFSNSNADIVAPGVGILSAKPGGGTTTMSGTSQAAPHVAGVAALWWQALQRQGRSPTPTMVRDELMRASRRDLVAAGGDPAAVGAGLVMAPIQGSDG